MIVNSSTSNNGEYSLQYDNSTLSGTINSNSDVKDSTIRLDSFSNSDGATVHWDSSNPNSLVNHYAGTGEITISVSDSKKND